MFNPYSYTSASDQQWHDLYITDAALTAAAVVNLLAATNATDTPGYVYLRIVESDGFTAVHNILHAQLLKGGQTVESTASYALNPGHRLQVKSSVAGVTFHATVVRGV